MPLRPLGDLKCRCWSGGQRNRQRERDVDGHGPCYRGLLVAPGRLYISRGTLAPEAAIPHAASTGSRGWPECNRSATPLRIPPQCGHRRDLPGGGQGIVLGHRQQDGARVGVGAVFQHQRRFAGRQSIPAPALPAGVRSAGLRSRPGIAGSPGFSGPTARDRPVRGVRELHGRSRPERTSDLTPMAIFTIGADGRRAARFVRAGPQSARRR